MNPGARLGRTCVINLIRTIVSYRTPRAFIFSLRFYSNSLVMVTVPGSWHRGVIYQVRGYGFPPVLRVFFSLFSHQINYTIHYSLKHSLFKLPDELVWLDTGLMNNSTTTNTLKNALLGTALPYLVIRLARIFDLLWIKRLHLASFNKVRLPTQSPLRGIQ